MSALTIITVSRRAERADQVRSETKESRYSSSAAVSNACSVGFQPGASGPRAMLSTGMPISRARPTLPTCWAHSYSDRQFQPVRRIIQLAMARIQFRLPVDVVGARASGGEFGMTG